MTAIPFIIVSSYCLDTILRLRAVIAASMLLVMPFTFASICEANDRRADVPTRIQAGTTITDAEIDDWSHLVMLATPVVASGDVNEVSKMVKKYASMFSTVIAAKVQKRQDRHQIVEIGVGLAIKTDSGFRITSTRQTDTKTESGDGLGVIATTVLRAAEQSLDRMRISLRHESAVFLDCPALVTAEEMHRDLDARHLVWVHPTTGNLASAVWFIEPTEPARIYKNEGAILPSGFREQRRMHVSDREFLFGIPGKRAFALEDLPSGKRFTFGSDASIASAATASSVSLTDLQTIAQHLSTVATN